LEFLDQASQVLNKIYLLIFLLSQAVAVEVQTLQVAEALVVLEQLRLLFLELTLLQLALVALVVI
jgi:hypothetical protein